MHMAELGEGTEAKMSKPLFHYVTDGCHRMFASYVITEPECDHQDGVGKFILDWVAPAFASGVEAPLQDCYSAAPAQEPSVATCLLWRFRQQRSAVDASRLQKKPPADPGSASRRRRAAGGPSRR